MASSTSSSEGPHVGDRLPRGPWLRTWLLAGGLVGAHVAFVLHSESEWFQDPTSPDARVRYVERHSLARVDAPSVVVLGSSRAAFSLVPSQFDRAVGLVDRSTVNAGFPGGKLSIFESLLNRNPRLGEAATVVLFVDEYFFLAPVEPPAAVPRSPELEPVQRLEGWLRSRVADSTSLVARMGWLRHHVLVAAGVKQKAGFDDWQLDERGFWRASNLGSNGYMQDPTTANSLATSFADLYYADQRISESHVVQYEALCRRIVDGGAELVLVQMPPHPLYHAAVEARYGAVYAGHREHFERLAARVGARFYCFEDPGDCGITPDDYADPVHLTHEGAERFTAHLAQIARSERWVGRSPNALAAGVKPGSAHGASALRERQRSS